MHSFVAPVLFRKFFGRLTFFPRAKHNPLNYSHLTYLYGHWCGLIEWLEHVFHLINQMFVDVILPNSLANGLPFSLSTIVIDE